MGAILPLALAAAAYPQLLAVVVVILTRPRPKPLLWACYLASLSVSVIAGAVILAIFRSRGSVAGTSSSGLGPSAYIMIGGLALVLAVFAATRRGRELLGHDLPRVRLRSRGEEPGTGLTSATKSRAKRALEEGSLPVAAAAGAILGVPGPFDLLALGHVARQDHARLALVAMIIAFAMVKLALIELPLISYAVRPEHTALEVERLAGWMQAHKFEVVAAVVAVISVGLIVRGIAGLG